MMLFAVTALRQPVPRDWSAACAPPRLRSRPARASWWCASLAAPTALVGLDPGCPSTQVTQAVPDTVDDKLKPPTYPSWIMETKGYMAWMPTATELLYCTDYQAVEPMKVMRSLCPPLYINGISSSMNERCWRHEFYAWFRTNNGSWPIPLTSIIYAHNLLHCNMLIWLSAP